MQCENGTWYIYADVAVCFVVFVSLWECVVGLRSRLLQPETPSCCVFMRVWCVFCLVAEEREGGVVRALLGGAFTVRS